MRLANEDKKCPGLSEGQGFGSNHQQSKKENEPEMNSVSSIASTSDDCTAWERPVWAAATAPDVFRSVDEDNNPVHGWQGEQLGGGNIDARLTRDDVYLIDEERIQEGPMLLSLYIDDSDLITLTSPADARAVAHALLSAADGFERVRGSLAAPTVQHRGPGWDEVEIPITKADGSLAVIREKGVNVVDDDGVTASGWCVSVTVSDRRLLTAEAARTLSEEINSAAALVDQLNAQADA